MLQRKRTGRPSVSVAVFGIVVSLTPRPAVAVYCGARCVDHVLHRLRGDSEDLVMLIQELNGESQDAIPSFLAVASCLRRRGVGAVFIDRDALPDLQLNCLMPVVVHVNGNHFAVLDSKTNGKFVVWWGPGNTRLLTWEGFRRRTAPVVLVTAELGSEKLRKSVAQSLKKARVWRCLAQSAFVLLMGLAMLVSFSGRVTPLRPTAGRGCQLI